MTEAVVNNGKKRHEGERKQVLMKSRSRGTGSHLKGSRASSIVEYKWIR